MKLQNLHAFTAEDWKTLESQFAGFAVATIEFVTENKGSLSEAESIYTEAFIYYTQLIELRGPRILEKGEQIIYSFARKLWIQKLEKRNVDTDYVSHKRAFYEMEDAFHEIDSINARSEKTAAKLAVIGEPARTLILEHIGKRQDLAQVAGRLGFSDEERAWSRISKSLRKLIRDADSKNFEVTDAEFEQLVRFVLDHENSDGEGLSEQKKVGVTIISRTVAMIRSYVNRKERQQRLRELQERIDPDTRAALKKSAAATSGEPRRMKPFLVMAITAVVATCVSLITAFALLGMMNQNREIESPSPMAVASTHIPDDRLVNDTLPESVGNEEKRVDELENLSYENTDEDRSLTAFAITADGWLLTSASVGAQGEVQLLQGDSVYNAEILFADTVSGLAILHSKLKFYRLPYRLAPDENILGQEVYTVGYPYDRYYFTAGVLHTLDLTGWGKTSIHQASPGSPVIADHGQVYGMVVKDANRQESTKVLQIEQLREVLSSWEKSAGKKLQLPGRNGLFYSDVSEQVKKVEPYVFRIERK